MGISFHQNRWKKRQPASRDCADLHEQLTLAQYGFLAEHRHNREVGTIGVVPTSAQRRI
jgi:hypothetical protein